MAGFSPPRHTVHRAYGFLISERETIPPLHAIALPCPIGSQDLVAPGRSRHLRYPTITNPEAPSLRAERHIPNSIATMRRRLIAAIVVRLPRCPCCAAPMARHAESLMTQ